MESTRRYPYATSFSTDRLTLRLADLDNDEDCRLIMTVYQDGSKPGSSSRMGINSIADVRRRCLANSARNHPHFCTKVPPEQLPPGVLLIFIKDTSDLVGFVGMSFRGSMPCPDFGYALLSPYWSKGYASEAGRASLQWWQETIGVKEICLGTVEENVRSQKTAERLGFVRGGTLEFVAGQGDPTSDRTSTPGIAYILPGMRWREEDDNGFKYHINTAAIVDPELSAAVPE